MSQGLPTSSSCCTMLAMELARRVEPHVGASRADHATPFGWSLVALLAVFATTSSSDIDLLGAKNSRLTLQEKLWRESTVLFNKIHGLQRPSSNYSVASVAILSPCDFGGRMCHPPPIMTSLALGDEQSAGCSSSSCERCSTVASASSSRSRRKRKRGVPTVRCDVCGDAFEDYDGWFKHIVHSSHCAEAGAEPEPFDAQQEALDDTLRVAGDAIYKAEIQSQLVSSYGALQYDRLMGRSAIQSGVKEGVVEPLVNTMREEIYRRLAKSPEERASLEAIIGTVFDVHRGIESTAKEENVLRATVDPVAPVRRELVDTPGANGKAIVCAYSVLIVSL